MRTWSHSQLPRTLKWTVLLPLLNAWFAEQLAAVVALHWVLQNLKADSASQRVLQLLVHNAILNSVKVIASWVVSSCWACSIEHVNVQIHLLTLIINGKRNNTPSKLFLCKQTHWSKMLKLVDKFQRLRKGWFPKQIKTCLAAKPAWLGKRNAIGKNEWWRVYSKLITKCVAPQLILAGSRHTHQKSRLNKHRTWLSRQNKPLQTKWLPKTATKKFCIIPREKPRKWLFTCQQSFYSIARWHNSNNFIKFFLHFWRANYIFRPNQVHCHPPDEV